MEVLDMATQTGALSCHDGTGVSTTHDLVQLTTQVNQVAFTNRHATQELWVVVFTGATAAAALVNATAGAAVANADEAVLIPPTSKRKVVFKSPRKTYVAFRIIGTTGATPWSCEGMQWFD